jgi:hypothetical protein
VFAVDARAENRPQRVVEASGGTDGAGRAAQSDHCPSVDGIMLPGERPFKLLARAQAAISFIVPAKVASSMGGLAIQIASHCYPYSC